MVARSMCAFVDHKGEVKQRTTSGQAQGRRCCLKRMLRTWLHNACDEMSRQEMCTYLPVSMTTYSPALGVLR